MKRLFAAAFLWLAAVPALACEGEPAQPVRVWVMRGLAEGGSWGMDEIVRQLNRQKGVTASIHSNLEWRSVAEAARRHNGRIAFIGHSLGGVRAVWAAGEIKRDVALIVLFDIVPLSMASEVPANVGRVVDISTSGRWIGRESKKTEAKRVSSTVGHTRVDDHEPYQALAVAEVCALTK